MKQSTKLSGTSRNQKFMLVIVGLAVIMLGGMIAVGAQKPLPATPTPSPQPSPTNPALTTTPTTPRPTFTPIPDVSLAPQRFYANLFNPNVGGRMNITAFDSNGHALFKIPSDLDYYRSDNFAVSADGTRLIVNRGTGLSSFDTTTGAEMWYQPHESAGWSVQMTPNQQTILGLDYQREHYQLNLFDVATGTPQRSISISQDAGGFIGIDHKQRAWFTRSKHMTLVNLTDGISTTVPLEWRSPKAGALSPDGTRVIFLSDTGVLTTIDTETLEITTTSLNTTATINPYQLKIAPNNQDILVFANEDYNPIVREGRLEIASATNIWLVQDGEVIDLDQQISAVGGLQFDAATWSVDGLQIYLPNVSGLYVYDWKARTIGKAGDPPFATSSIGLVVAPDVAWNPSNQPTLTPIPTVDLTNPANYPPTATPKIITQPDTRDVAWLWDANTRKLIAVQRNGEQRMISNNAFRVMSRPNQAPVVLIDDGIDRWSLFDGTTNRIVALQSKAPRFYGAPNISNDVVLSPDQRQFAMIVSGDVIETDAFTHTPQLLIADIETGRVQVVTDYATTRSLDDSRLVAWRDQTLYYVEEASDYTPTFIERAYRFDLRTKTSEELRTFTENSLSVTIHPSTGWIVTETYTDADHAQIRMFNLFSFEDRLIHEGRFVNFDQVWFSPDGEQLAFVLQKSFDLTSLELYTVATGQRRTLIEAMQIWQNPTWLPNSQGLIATVWKNDDGLNGIQEMIVPVDEQAPQLFRAGTFGQVRSFFNDPDNPHVAVISTEFESEQRYTYLQRYASLNSTTPDISIPIGDQFMDTYSVQIVWVGE